MQNRRSGNAQGIDVSHHQGNINWSNVAKSGISFAYIKATQNRIDTKFIENALKARAAGLLIGAYHYLDESVTTVVGAKSAANKFFTAIQAAGGIDLPPVLDYESKASGISASQATVIAKAFLEEIQRLTGMTPILYTYPSFIGNFTGLSKYPLWIARYSATRVPESAQGWIEWDFWQYSDGTDGGTLPNGTRKVQGIAGPVDLNEFNGTEAQLRAKYGKQPVKENKIVQTNVTYIYGKEKAQGKGVLINNINYVPIRELEKLFGFQVKFDAITKVATINGKPIMDGQLIGSITYVQAKVLVKAFNGELDWNNDTKTLTIQK